MARSVRNQMRISNLPFSSITAITGAFLELARRPLNDGVSELSIELLRSDTRIAKTNV